MTKYTYIDKLTKEKQTLYYDIMWYDSYSKTLDKEKLLKHMEKYVDCKNILDTEDTSNENFKLCHWLEHLDCNEDYCGHILIIEEVIDNKDTPTSALIGYIYGRIKKYDTLEQFIENDVNISVPFRNKGLCKEIVGIYCRKLIEVYSKTEKDFYVYVNDNSTLRELHKSDNKIPTAMSSCYMPSYESNGYVRNKTIPKINNVQHFTYKNNKVKHKYVDEDDFSNFLSDF